MSDMFGTLWLSRRANDTEASGGLGPNQNDVQTFRWHDTTCSYKPSGHDGQRSPAVPSGGLGIYTTVAAT
eukprot:3495858-Pyramimonas_sp.AAC.1